MMLPLQPQDPFRLSSTRSDLIRSLFVDISPLFVTTLLDPNSWHRKNLKTIDGISASPPDVEYFWPCN